MFYINESDKMSEKEIIIYINIVFYIYLYIIYNVLLKKIESF